MYLQNPFEEIDKRLSNIESLLLDIKHPPPTLEPSDRCQLKDACEITGLSKAALYKATHQRKIPHAKFGSRLIFSRRQLADWVAARTIPSASPEDEINANLVKSAKKHLRHEK